VETLSQSRLSTAWSHAGRQTEGPQLIDKRRAIGGDCVAIIASVNSGNLESDEIRGEVQRSPRPGAWATVPADPSCRDQRTCPRCGGELTGMTGETEDLERITTVETTYMSRTTSGPPEKYRCPCRPFAI
jgi:hypothetical protein